MIIQKSKVKNGERMITYSVINYLVTRDVRFSVKAFETFNSLLSRSQLIRSTGEKDKIKFFSAHA